MANPIAGRLLGFSVNGNFIDCQTDGTMTLTANLTEQDPCKPAPDSASSQADFIQREVASRDVQLTFSNKAFATSLQANPNVWNNNDLINLFLLGNLEVDYVFATTKTTDSDLTHIVTWSGKGILSSITFNAPGDGNASTDVEISGNGAPTMTITEVE